ncbi:MAG: NRDE family protein [Pseudomonadales bacterium]
MCILFVALGEHPRYPLIVAANRDEEFARPSETARFWSDSPDIYGGRDLLAGGTWLAVNKTGRIAAITNLRMPNLYKDNPISRGGLIPDYLRCESEVQFKEQLCDTHHLYNPFNLMFGTMNELTVYNSATNTFVSLGRGFHSVSNGPLDDYWPKMSRGVSLLETHVLERTDRELDIERLIGDMRDTTQADETLLPQTGVGVEFEKLLSSIFIEGDRYGTRTTSVLTFDRQSLTFYEVDYDATANSRHNSKQLIEL